MCLGGHQGPLLRSGLASLGLWQRGVSFFILLLAPLPDMSKKRVKSIYIKQQRLWALQDRCHLFDQSLLLAQAGVGASTGAGLDVRWQLSSPAVVDVESVPAGRQHGGCQPGLGAPGAE